MKKICVLFLYLLPLVIQAQFVIEGKVTDTSSLPLPSASVVVLNQIDSALVSFGLSNEQGEFSLSLTEKGDYFIQYSFLGYQTVMVPIETNWEQKNIRLPLAKMSPSDFQLSEVSITANRIPLQLKGDTLVYDAAAFKTKTGDDVEKLLELFPGISIDSEGNLMAQGKKVDKVLVNGKEFFGKNIEMATKNLEAEMVKKVEVFNKQSENAEFTGIKDGNEKRTINLQLKEEYKKGSFGRATLAAGNEETYSGKMNYNRFNSNTQTSILGGTNNINLNSYQSITNLRAGANGQGITDRYNMGFNLSHDFSTKLFTDFYYTLRQSNNTVQNTVFSQNFTDSSTFETDQISEDESTTITHRFNHRLQWKIDSMTETSLETSIDLREQNRSGLSSTKYTPSLFGESVESNTDQLNDQVDFSTHFVLRRRFRKDRRSWINHIRVKKINIEEETELLNVTFGESLNQLQTFDETSLQTELNSTFVEPINDKWFTKLVYEYQLEQNKPERSFFDRINEDLRFNDSLSLSFQRLLSVHDGEFSMNKNNDKLTSSVGFNARNNKLETSGLSKDFNFLLPFLRIQYRFTSTKSTRFSYVTRSRIPQINQLITITNNINPNQNYIGNIDLNPEYVHTLNWSFYNFNTSNQRSYNTSVSFTKTLDKIVNQTVVGENLTSFTSPVNTDFYESFNLNGGLSGKIEKVNARYRINLRFNQDYYDAFLNESTSKVRSQAMSARIVLSRLKKEHWDLRFGADYSLNTSSFEVNSNFNQQSSNFSWFANGEVEIFKSLKLQADYRIQRLNDVSFFEGRILHFVNASISKSFGEDLWKTFIVVNDLLNESIGVQRSSTINSLSEQTYNTRQQYFMVGLSRKFGKRANKKGKFD